MVEVADTIHANNLRLAVNDTNINASGASLIIDQLGSGDSSIVFRLGKAGQNYSIGIDNSNNDAFTISGGSGLNTTNIVMTSSGRLGIGASPPTSAGFSISNTANGFLPPVMTAAQVHAISTPAAGLMVYNSTSGAIMFYTDAWRFVSGANFGT